MWLMVGKKQGVMTTTAEVPWPFPLTDGVGGGLSTLLVNQVVTGDCAKCGLQLNGLPIWADQHTGHHTKGAKP